MKGKNKLIRSGYLLAALGFLIELIILVERKEISHLTNIFLTIPVITMVVTSIYDLNTRKKKRKLNNKDN